MNDFDKFYDAAIRVFNRYDHEGIDKDTMRKELVLPYMEFWNAYFPDLKKEDHDKVFSEEISKKSIIEPELFPGVKDTLQYLIDQDCRLGIITSTIDEILQEQVKKTGVENYFDFIQGGIHQKRIDLRKTMQSLGIEYHETLFVGDMVGDIKSGQYNCAHTAAVEWGYQDPEILAWAGPTYLIKNIKDLEQIVKRSKDD